MEGAISWRITAAHQAKHSAFAKSNILEEKFKRKILLFIIVIEIFVSAVKPKLNSFSVM